MHNNLFRSLDNTDLRWSHVGPQHERAYFNLLDLVGYAPAKWGVDQPPYKIYNPYRWTGEKVPEGKTYATIPVAKRAARALVLSWLSQAGTGPVVWEDTDTGVHFWAHADGLEIAKMYFCPEKKGNWHKDFRVWFGGTYYIVDFANPEEAKAAVADTWSQWLAIAKERLLIVPNVSRQGRREGEA